MQIVVHFCKFLEKLAVKKGYLNVELEMILVEVSLYCMDYGEMVVFGIGGKKKRQIFAGAGLGSAPTNGGFIVVWAFWSCLIWELVCNYSFETQKVHGGRNFLSVDYE